MNKQDSKEASVKDSPELKALAMDLAAGKQVATQAPANLPALPVMPSADELREVFEANFEGITPAFEMIKIPTGGIPIWMIPGEGVEPDMEKEMQGVVLDHYPTRVYWPARMGSGSNVPPTCVSADAKTGSLPRNAGGEFGDCGTCKWAQFGSGTNADGSPGRSQACKKKHRVYVWLAGRDGIFPYLIPLPPTSAEAKYEGSFSTYVVKLSGKLKTLHSVRTKIKLVKDTNKEGIEFAKAQFFYVADLTPNEKAQAAMLRERLKPAMRNKPLESDEAVDHAPVGRAAFDSGVVEPGGGKDPWEN